MKQLLRFLLVAAALPLSPTAIQAQTFVNWTGGAGNWTDVTKWFNDGTQGTGALPSSDFIEVARIDNGGVVTVNTPLADGTSAGFSTNVANLLVGAVGGTGELVIASGGSLHVQSTLATSGLLDVGFGAGTGTVRVLPGGSLRTDSWFSNASNPANFIQLGAPTGAGTATINAGMSSFQGTTIVYPNVNYQANALVEVAFSGTYTAVISGANAATLKTNGFANLQGILRPDFGGVTPAAGSSWNLFEADEIAGTFRQIDTSLAGTPGPGQRYLVDIVDVGNNREAARLSLRQLPTLTVNRDTGAATISNTGAINVMLDGYTVSSNVGSLSSANWNSLEEQSALGGGWKMSPSPGSANRLSELKQTGVGTLAGGAQVALGSIFNATPAGAAFGANTEDLTFEYTTTDGTFQGLVAYTGTKVNNLLLQVNPTTGQASLRNPSATTVQIDGYTITSAGGQSLDPVAWNSLDEQDAAGGDWADSPGTAARLSELKQGGATTLAPGASFDLGALFDETKAQDLGFAFLLADDFEPTTGRVIYAASTPGGLPGDFDGNGTVNAADLTKWRNDFGAGAGSDADGDGDTDGNDFLVWQRNLGTGGATGAAGAVPEPGALALLAIAAAIGGAWRPSRRRCEN